MSYVNDVNEEVEQLKVEKEEWVTAFWKSEAQREKLEADLKEAVNLILTIHAGNTLRISDDVSVNDFLNKRAKG